MDLENDDYIAPRDTRAEDLKRIAEDLVKTYQVSLAVNRTKSVTVRAWNKRNARLSGSRVLGVKPGKVFVEAVA